MEKKQTRYTIGVDIGTDSARVCIVDDSGTLIATASQVTQTWQSRVGCYEQSTSDIWKSICTCLQTALNDSKIDTASVDAIVFDATCSLAVFDAETHAPISVAASGSSSDEHNVILWMHCGATREADVINSTNHRALQYLGGTISPFMALAKALWLKNNIPPDQFEKCQFFDLQDAMSFIATGNSRVQCNSRCDRSTEPGFGVDGTIKGWDRDLLKRVGLDCLLQNRSRQIGGLCYHGRHPAIGAPVGTLCDQAAFDLGLPSHVIVGTGVIDCYAGWVGTVGTQKTQPPNGPGPPSSERIAIVAGTSACHIIASDRSHFVKGLWGPYSGFLLPGSHTIAGGQPAVGRLVQHIIETHPAYQDVRHKAECRNQTIFDYLNSYLQDMQASQELPSITHLGRHTFFYGDHFGNRAPIADTDMKGSIVGLTGDTDINNLAIMYYCTLEFLALQTRHIITTMKDSGHRISAIFMSGSVCQNPLFTRLVATVCDLPVIVPYYPTAAVCYGSALLAAHTRALANNEPADGLWSIMTRMSKPGNVVVPDPDEYTRDLLEVKYTIFLEQAERQRVFRKMIDAVSEKYTSLR